MSLHLMPFKGAWQDPRFFSVDPKTYVPARGPRKSGCSITGLCCSLVNGRQVSHDSYKEKLAINCFEYASSVDRYFEQPKKIKFLDKYRDQSDITPDFLVYFRSPDIYRHRIEPLFIEVKQEEALKEWSVARAEGIEVAKQYAKIQGWRYVVLTDTDLRQFSSVVRWLNSQPHIHMSSEQVRLIEFLEKEGPSTILDAAFHIKNSSTGIDAAGDLIGRMASEGHIQILGELPVTWFNKISIPNKSTAIPGNRGMGVNYA